MQHPSFPAVDNTQQMAELALALRTTRPLAGAALHHAATTAPPGPSSYQHALVGLLHLAVKQAEGIEWAMRTGNVPVTMTSFRVLIEMWINLDYLSSDPLHRERRSCQLMLEYPERSLRLLAKSPTPSSPSKTQGIKAFEDERDELVAAIAALPKHPDDKDGWVSRKGVQGLSTGQRARLRGFDLEYDFLYEIGSAYAHGDGYAIVHGGSFTPSHWVNIPDQASLTLMEFVRAVLDEFPELGRGVVAQAWDAWAAGSNSHPQQAGSADQSNAMQPTPVMEAD